MSKNARIENLFLQVRFSDKKTYRIPVVAIALNRAQYYVSRGEFGGINESYTEDTLPLFEADHNEILDWAFNNMGWGEVKDIAVRVKLKEKSADYAKEWTNAKARIVVK